MNTPARGAALACLVVGLSLLGGCTGGLQASGDPTPTTRAGTPTAPPEVSAQEIARALTAAEAAAVVGTTRGDVPVGGDRTRPVVAEVYSVAAYPDRTVVHFALASGDGEEVGLLPSSLSVEPGSWQYLEGLAIIDPESRQRLLSYRDADGQGSIGESVFQTCSLRPKTLTAEKVPQTCVLSALDPETESVTFEIPHLPAIEDVPVTRHEK